MARKTGLGRGLDALISSPERPATGVVTYIPIKQIAANPRQPRIHMDADELTELAASIREHGILQPLLVTYDENTEQYTLVAGSRRLLAAAQAGLESVPAIVRQANEQQRLEMALIENLQRADLNPLEAAQAYQQLNQEFGLAHEEIAARVGKSRTAITNTLRLLKLPSEIKNALADERISEGHARALLMLPTEEAQLKALAAILERSLSVRQTEELVKRMTGSHPRRRPNADNMPEIRALEERLRSRLGTRVRLTRRRKGGTLVIYFYSDEEFESILNNLLGEDAG